MTLQRPTTAQPPSGSRVGEVLAGKYRLEELLGSGGMGDVYRAVNEHVGRRVAIKLLRKEHAKNEQVVDRFMREARAANLVRHENVVDVIDIGQDEYGFPFIVQELLDGEDLGAYARKMGGRISLEEAIDMLCPVIDALAVAHASGVVHRDIKPENVFLVRKDKKRIPKLLDFGISKVRSGDIRTTEAGVMLGTPAYMAPEQVQGARDADARTDVWAMGVMLFELLSGRLPFDARDAPALFVMIATQDAPKLLDVAPEIPPTVSRLVERCLRRKPDDRYPSAAELARDLRHVLDGTEIEPTLRRSIPPGLAALVPDLMLPKTPNPPRMAKEELVEAGVDSADARQLTGKVPAHVAAAARAVTDKPKPVVPDLIQAAPKPPAPKPAPRSAPKMALERQAQQPEEEAPLSLATGRANAPAQRQLARNEMPGLMSVPGVSTRARAAAPTHQPTHQKDAFSQNIDDLTPFFIGIGVVGVTALVAFAVLMQVAHRPDGWPLLAFLSKPGSPVITVGQAGLSLICGAICITYMRRGVKHWRGELAGGPLQTVISGLIGAAMFFAAVEFATAAM